MTATIPPSSDLVTTPLEDTSWQASDRDRSLKNVFQHVRSDALDAISWYARRRRPKRWIATLTRLLAIFLIGAAAILPLVDSALGGNAIPAVWISIAVTLGAGAIAFDRFLGSSSGWIRYIKTEQQIRDALEFFELDWEVERASWQGNDPTLEQVSSMLSRAKAFATQINSIVQEETNAWVDEFQSSIRQVDDALKAKATRDAKGRTNGAGAEVATNGTKSAAESTPKGGNRITGTTGAEATQPPANQ
jgi:hypothetical protein